MLAIYLYIPFSFFGSSLLFFFALSSNLRIALSILFDGIAFISPGYGPSMNDSKKKREDKFNFECVNRIYEQTTLSDQMACYSLAVEEGLSISSPFCAFILLCLFVTSATQIIYFFIFFMKLFIGFDAKVM